MRKPISLSSFFGRPGEEYEHNFGSTVSLFLLKEYTSSAPLKFNNNLVLDDLDHQKQQQRLVAKRIIFHLD